MAELQAVEVTVHYSPEGAVTPLSFRWRERLYRVEAAGRRWQAEDGWHILVLTTRGQGFEMVFTAADNRWYLGQPGPGPMAF